MKKGRPKDPRSIRSLGMTHVALDKPTRKTLKGLAAAEGITLTEYLRYLAEIGERKGKQISQPGEVSNATRRENILMTTINNLSDFLANKILDSFQFTGETDAELVKFINLMTKLGSPEYAANRLMAARDLLRMRQEFAAQQNQAKFKLTLGEKEATA